MGLPAGTILARGALAAIRAPGSFLKAFGPVVVMDWTLYALYADVALDGWRGVAIDVAATAVWVPAATAWHRFMLEGKTRYELGMREGRYALLLSAMIAVVSVTDHFLRHGLWALPGVPSLPEPAFHLLVAVATMALLAPLSPSVLLLPAAAVGESRGIFQCYRAVGRRPAVYLALAILWFLPDALFAMTDGLSWPAANLVALFIYPLEVGIISLSYTALFAPPPGSTP